MTEPYKRLEENSSEPNTPTPPEPKPQPNPIIVPQIIQQTTAIQPQNGGKAMKTLKILVFVKLALGIMVTLLGATCVGVLISDGYRVGCYIGSGIWVGVLAVVSASIGIVATRKPNNRCLLIAYFVLCVVATVFCVELVIVSSIHAERARDRLRYRYSDYYDRSYYSDNYYDGAEAGLGINAALALLAGIHFICAIIASSLICTIWSRTGCCNAAEQHQTPPVIFIQTQPGVAGTNLPSQAIIIQQGKTQTVPIYIPQQPMMNTTG